MAVLPRRRGRKGFAGRGEGPRGTWLAAAASFALVFLVTNEGERPAALAHPPDLVHQRLLAPVRYPDLFGPRGGNGGDEPGPVAMVGDNERQLDPLLPRTRPDPHPA